MNNDKIHLNLGCGDLPVKGALNIDFRKGERVDEVVDLNATPWKWKDASIDGIYMIHSLEHFPDPSLILRECHRILKKGGFLYLQVPHSSCCSGLGNLGHYRVFSANTFTEYLSNAYYVFDRPLFKTELCRLIWWGLPRNERHPYVKFNVRRSTTAFPFLYSLFIYPLSLILQKLIDLSPRAFERFWCYYVGGAEEVIWKGTKL